MTRLSSEGEPIEVWGEKTAPNGFVWQGTRHRILETSNHWCVHTRWWEPGEAIWREYLKVITDTGHLCLIYFDVNSERWFLARLYD